MKDNISQVINFLKEKPEGKKYTIFRWSDKNFSMIKQIEEFILRNNHKVHLYRYQGALWRIFFDSKKGMLIKEKMDRYGLRVHLSQFITLKKQLKNGETKNIPLPFDIALPLCRANPDSLIPEIKQIFCSPTILPDGTVLQKAGYDAERQVLMAFEEGAFNKVSENPTITDAIAARTRIEYIFGEVDFVSPRDKSVGLALLLTMLMKPYFEGGTPAFGVSSFAAESGKTKLIQICSQIITGKEVSAVTFPSNSLELRMSLLAWLKQGERCILIDNVENTPVCGDALCTVLTSPSYTYRRIGSSDALGVSTKESVITVTGNNLVVKGDLTTRMLMCHLKSPHPNPEKRPRKRDIDEIVRKQRNQCIVDAITLVKAFIEVKDREKLPNPAPSRFRDWELIRKTVIWIDGEDPFASSQKLVKEDPVIELLAPVLGGLLTVFGWEGFTAKDILGALAGNEFQEIKEPLEDFMGHSFTEKRDFDTRLFSRKFSQFEGRIFVDVPMKLKDEFGNPKHKFVKDSGSVRDIQTFDIQFMVCRKGNPKKWAFKKTGSQPDKHKSNL